MRAIAGRIGFLLIGMAVAAAAVSMSFVFLCYALFALLAAYLPAAAAALLTAAGILCTALLGLLAMKAGSRRRAADRPFAAGEALGSMFAESLKGLAAKNPTASIVASLLAGFVAGVQAGRSKA